MLGSSSSFSNSSGMNLMQSNYVAGKNPGAYAGGGYDEATSFSNYQQQHPSDDMHQPTMQTGIATMMTSHGNGGFSDFMQADQPGNTISDSDDEDLFSVSL